jgi:hypothetical protein
VDVGKGKSPGWSALVLAGVLYGQTKNDRILLAKLNQHASIIPLNKRKYINE